MSGLVIDCHGHFTSEPQAFHDFRAAQVALAEGRSRARPEEPRISDDELRTIVEANQLRLQTERGSDVTILSPRASGMGHHLADTEVAARWSRFSNDTVRRIADLFPRNFVPVCQLPQTVDLDLDGSLDELERCAAAGFVGCNVNPDPSGGRWSSPPLTDAFWDPLWETLVRLEMPAMIHVSGSQSAGLHTTGAHYIAADTIVFMQLVAGDLFERHPDLRLVIPHGGGAAPFHWGRYRGLADALGRPALADMMGSNLFFDTCVYHQAGIDLLFDVVGPESLLFGSELLGAVKTVDPETDRYFDDTKRYIDACALDDDARGAVFQGNARRVYPRLDALLTEQGR